MSLRRILKKVFGFTAPLFYRMPFIYRGYHTALALLAAWKYGFPGTKMTVIGVTGTNGKTTTSLLIARILKAAGYSVGLSTTVSIWTGDKETVNHSKLTSFGPEAYHKLLSEMKKGGNTIAVVETSSHALKQNRIAGTIFTGAVFTNISRDHLDYHQDADEYFFYKSQLFRHLQSSGRFPASMAVNANDPKSRELLAFSAKQKIAFGAEMEGIPNVIARDISMTDSGSTFSIIFPDGSTQEIDLHLLGNFNVDNALAAASICFALGIQPDIIARALNEARPVSGRMELVQAKPYKVIVDYAHTPDGYEKALSSAKAFTTGKLIVVFGSAGERDHGKRPDLGSIAAKYGDRLILTEEDPGIEDAAVIVQEVVKGIKTEDHHKVETILDRREALKRALAEATPGDTVIALGMGAQTVMKKGSEMIPYNEKETINEILKSL